jgi:gas vesicle protein
MSRTSDNSLAFGVGTLVGVLAGVALGILFSPKSGEEMRKDLKDTVEKIAGKDTPEVVYAKRKSTAAIEKLQYTLEAQFSRVMEAIKAGKMAAAKRKEELESNYRY